VKAKAATRQAEELFVQLEDDLGPDEAEDWTIGFKALFELMEGKESRVLEVTEDWREALGAWGLWVNPGGRREDLP
jgi:nuclear pore complex protein Nup85